MLPSPITCDSPTSYCDLLPCPLLLTDRKGLVLEVNQGLCDLVGFDKQSWIAKSMETMFPKASTIFLQTHIWPMLLRESQIREIRMQLLTAEGKQVAVLVNCQMTIVDGVEHYAWVFFVATERSLFEQELLVARQRAQEMTKALSKSENFLRIVSDSTPNLIAYWSADLRCQFANKPYLEWFGWTAQELVGMPMSSALGQRQFELNLPYIDGVMAGVAQEFEQTIRKPEGSLGYTLVNYVPDFDANGKAHGFFAFVQDISRMKEAAAELVQAREKAEAASLAKSQFLANMSHEMRTPINAIVGVQQILARTPLSEDQRSFLAASTSSAQSLLALVNDILDMSKIEAGKLDIVGASFEITDVMQAVVSMLRPSANAKNLRLLLEISPEVPPVLLGDCMRLRQVLLNLGSNSIKFTETGEIRVCIAVISRSAKDVLLHFSVQDTGIGIPPEMHVHIFGAFNQVDSTVRRNHGGTGLGLSISQALVKAMGGALELQSEEGKGSIFSFDLRFAIAPSNAMLEIAEASTAVPAPQLPHQHSSSIQPEISKRLLGLRILVAEDQPLNRMVVERILELEGAKVEMVDDGLKAVNAVQQAHQQGHLFDAVLMDIQMPVLSGLEATRAIRNKPGLGSDQLPILAVTANVMAEDVLNCLDAGMNGHIPKPVNADELVRQLLASTAKV